MNIRVFLRVFILILICHGVSAYSPLPAGIDEDVLSYTNKFRRARGKSELVMRAELNAIATRHSENMAKGRVAFGHGGFSSRHQQALQKIDGTNAFAENVAFGAENGKDAVEQWKNSPGHRKNMLGKYRYIGIGTARDKQGRIYYTQVFVD